MKPPHATPSDFCFRSLFYFVCCRWCDDILHECHNRCFGRTCWLTGYCFCWSWGVTTVTRPPHPPPPPPPPTPPFFRRKNFWSQRTPRLTSRKNLHENGCLVFSTAIFQVQKNPKVSSMKSPGAWDHEKPVGSAKTGSVEAGGTGDDGTRGG